jgi:hypothetical protein
LSALSHNSNDLEEKLQGYKPMHNRKLAEKNEYLIDVKLTRDKLRKEAMEKRQKNAPKKRARHIKLGNLQTSCGRFDREIFILQNKIKLQTQQIAELEKIKPRVAKFNQ